MEDSTPSPASTASASIDHASAIPGVSIVETGTTPARTLAVQIVPADSSPDIWKHVADIAGAAAWPIVALVALWLLRTQLRQFVHTLSIRAKDPNTSIKFGPFELAIRDLKLGAEETNARLQVLTQLDATQIHAAAAPEVAKPIPEQLRTLAKQYVDVSDPVPEKRIQQKDDLAAKMASLVIREQIPRETLASETSDGLRTALATVVNSVPLAGDDEWLAKSAKGASLMHTRYRVMMAIARLARLGLLSPARAREFIALAESYKKPPADSDLLERIERTVELLTPLVV